MLSFKKALAILPIGLFAIPVLTSCNNNGGGGTSPDGTIYLKVLNSEDYIYKQEEDDEPVDLITQFEEYMAMPEHGGKKVRVIYDTFDTMENMYNTLKTGKTSYDLICASEYMIQKLAREKVNGVPLIQKLDTSKDGAIKNYYGDYQYSPTLGQGQCACSPYIREKLQNIPAIAGQDKAVVGTLDDYAVCYMWGTLGIIYNPDFKTFKQRNISPEDIHNDMNDWGSLWNSKYNKTISIKDSMRDTYAIGVMHSYKDELDKASGFDARNTIFNYGGEADKNAKEHINTVKEDLLKLRNNVFGFEVDSGKQDIVAGKIGIDTAWSGDAVYSMDQGDEEGSATLYYSIPEEGTNLWFDCWAMQSSCKGENKVVANEFLNFISDPINAIQNMGYIGYTSPIAGSDIYHYFQDIKYVPSEGVTPEDYDVSYFFKDTSTGTVNFKIDPEISNRQMAAQFPKDNLKDKLMIMQDYGNNNDLILRMWEQVKHERLPNWAIALLSVEGALAVAGVTIIVVLKVNDKKRRRKRKPVAVKA